jgi:TolB-like protein
LTIISKITYIDIGEIAEQLNVGTVLEGSVQSAGDKVRVTAQLIDAESGFHLWSGNYDHDLDDIFAIQDEIVNEVVAALKISLLGESVQRLEQRDWKNTRLSTARFLRP